MKKDDQKGLSLIVRPAEQDEITRKLGDIAAARMQVTSAHDGLETKANSTISYTSRLKLKSGANNKSDGRLHFVDTHAHIHDPEFKFDDPDQIIKDAAKAGVDTIIVVGTSVEDSFLAAEFALKYDRVFAIIGSHPHEAKKDLVNLHRLEEILKDAKLKAKVVGVGEIGLDYYYQNSPRGAQMESLKQQLILANKYNLPVSFHVREAFDDFWSVYDKFKPIGGVLHSFTDSKFNMEKALERGLFFGINGISTFTKDEAQLEMFNSIPLERTLLETDSPFLTPVPHRGTMNVSAYTRLIAEDISNKRGLDLAEVAGSSTDNACFLFNLPHP